MSESTVERRLALRHSSDDAHGITAARIRPGHSAQVIDVSAGGACVETSHRLLPGTSVELQIERADGRASMRGRVLRCSVIRVRAASMSYSGAIAFDRHLPWFSDDARSRESDVSRRPGFPDGVDATREVV